MSVWFVHSDLPGISKCFVSGLGPSTEWSGGRDVVRTSPVWLTGLIGQATLTPKHNATRTKPLARRPTGRRMIRSRVGGSSQEVLPVTKLLQRMHYKLVRR